jgi:HNH endonuclease
VSNNEPWLVRTISHATGTRVQSFCNAVRSRDRRCAISGEQAAAAYIDDWTGFEVAHIFPLAYEGHWIQHNYDRWITISPENDKGGSINSIQNGLLLRSDIHQLFDNYSLSINPDVNLPNYLLSTFKLIFIIG